MHLDCSEVQLVWKMRLVSCLLFVSKAWTSVLVCSAVSCVMVAKTILETELCWRWILHYFGSAGMCIPVSIFDTPSRWHQSQFYSSMACLGSSQYTPTVCLMQWWHSTQQHFWFICCCLKPRQGWSVSLSTIHYKMWLTDRSFASAPKSLSKSLGWMCILSFLSQSTAFWSVQSSPSYGGLSYSALLRILLLISNEVWNLNSVLMYLGWS